jgi:nitrile hydratase accessory protein
MPADDNGPVFGEPWHAEAFALAIALHRQGVFDWNEWDEEFSNTLRDMPSEPGESAEAAYYRRWVLALENLVVDKSLASREEMGRRKELWRRAYLNTPHGLPVDLKHGYGERRGDQKAADHEHLQLMRRCGSPSP